ncbi:membrane protein insertion efficiency factor YidD [candidate division KSB1 bacterium]|nr:membrane protein insertion efficiency factor YidD [candidate division KSB1 bacterium]
MKTILRILIKFYQFSISPMLPSACRFQPTCSEYALDSIQKYGAFKGIIRALRRLLRCHPFSKKHGWDPA